MASKKLQDLFRHKSVQVVFCVVSTLVLAYFVYAWVGFIRQTHTRYISHDFVAASDELQKSPPGLERAETFLKRLKAIHTDYAPPAVKQALQDYISSLDQSLVSLKAGQATTPYDSAMADAKRRLIEAVRENE